MEQRITLPFGQILKELMKSYGILFESELFQQSLRGVRNIDEESFTDFKYILKLYVEQFKNEFS